MQVHNIKPVFNEFSEILILGSFPSVKSREAAFFYAHPQNRFWRVLSAVTGNELPITVEQKRSFLLSSHIAVWDVIAKCEISGSSDTSIRNVTANDISPILEHSSVKAVFTNGKTAYNLYNKYILPKSHYKAVCLPSTSPANAAYSLDKLTYCWNNEISRFLSIIQ